MPHVEEGWKAPAISYSRAVVEVVGRGGLGLPRARLQASRPTSPHQGLMLPPKLQPIGKLNLFLNLS